MSVRQGVECEINMKGATALMTVELDKEKGPQIRVVQNREPPSFLNLFNGNIHFVIVMNRLINCRLVCHH